MVVAIVYSPNIYRATYHRTYKLNYIILHFILLCYYYNSYNHHPSYTSSRSSILFNPWDTELVHLHSQLEQVIQALTLGLCFGNRVSPDIAAIAC